MSEQWIKAAEIGTIAENDTLGIEFEGENVCLYNLDGEVYATAGMCTHGNAELSQGFILDGGLIECPLHEGTFDIRTGAAVGAPCIQALRCYAVNVREGTIFIKSQ